MEEKAENSNPPFVSNRLTVKGLEEHAGISPIGNVIENNLEEGDVIAANYARDLASDLKRTLRAMQHLVAAGYVKPERVFQAFEHEDAMVD